jgi:hypothetical protein
MGLLETHVLYFRYIQTIILLISSEFLQTVADTVATVQFNRNLSRIKTTPAATNLEAHALQTFVPNTVCLRGTTVAGLLS